MFALYCFMIAGIGMTYLSCFWIAVHALSDSETFKRSPESKTDWSIVMSTFISLGIVLLISFIMGSKFLVAMAS